MEEKELKSIGFMTMGQAGPMAADTAMGEKELKLAEMVVHATVVPPLPLPPVSSRIDSDAASRKFLVDRCWPTGLINALISGLDRTTARFFICDDSESMMSSDGHWIVGEGASTKMIDCSRWSELTETLRFHGNIAHVSYAPTEFRMLNGAGPIMIGSTLQVDDDGIPALKCVLEGSPAGDRPLCHHVNEVAKQLNIIAPELRAAGKNAALIIFTDGEATDGDILASLRPLHDLPVWVVIRLCTDEESVVKYWNNVDSELGLKMDVLDDPMGEAKEIQRLNYWLTYGTPLHRLREFGFTAKEVDKLDQAKLSAEQMRNFCGFLFGVPPELLHNPETNWKEFYKQISDLNDKEPKVWSSVAKGPAPWINMANLEAVYGPKSRKKSRVTCCNIA